MIVSCANRGPKYRRLSATLVAVVIALCSRSADAVERAPKVDHRQPFRGNVFLPLDSNLRKQFEAVKEQLADGQWENAINQIQDLAQTENKSLVLVQAGKPGGFETYVNAATCCNLHLSRMPAEGRAVYRQKIDPQAGRWYQNWLRTRNEADLLRIVRQAYLSSVADDAIWALGEAAWDRGEFAAAALWWGQLLPLPTDADPNDYPTVLRYPDTEFDKAEILARIVLCSIMEAAHDRAAQELAELKQQYPQAEGWIAGRRGRLVDQLQQVLDQSLHWKRIPPAAEVATFGLSAQRFQPIPQSIDIGAMRWSHPLPLHLLPRAAPPLAFPNEPLCYHPVVHDKIVLVNDSDAIRAWNILTGEPAWQSDRKDPAVIYPAVPDEPSPGPEKNCVGTPHFTMTIAHDRLYARMGSPVTCSSTAELRPDLLSDLVCLDLTKEGKLLWKIAAHELFRDDPTWRFEGSPIIRDGKAYMAVCRRQTSLELMIVCLDSLTGQLLWQRPVGSFRFSVDDALNRVSHLLVTAGGGRIYLSTDAGVVVALDAVDGRTEWAVAYETRADDPPNISPNAGRKGLVPALYHDGRLFVAPSDANSAFCIEADSGRIQWKYSYLGNSPRAFPDALRKEQERNRLRDKQWRHLLGIVPGGASGRLIVSGSSLTAIDIDSGNVVWERNGGGATRSHRGDYGRGLIADGQILIPTRESIEVFDANTGVHQREVLLKTVDSPESGGNLIVAAGMLLVAESERLAAYGEFSRVKESMEHELTERPDDTRLRIHLADLETSEGHLAAAIDDYQFVIDHHDRADPMWLIARRKLAKLLTDAGGAEFARQQPRDARNYWRQAIEMMDDVTQRVNLIFEIAKADVELDDAEAALQRLQQILNDPRLATVERDNVRAGIVATRVMSELIAKYGRAAYASIEGIAATDFDAAIHQNDRQALRKAIEKYPHSMASENARMSLARMHRNANEVSEAFAILSQNGRMAPHDRLSVNTALATIELLQDAHYSDSAACFWKALAARSDSMEVNFRGSTRELLSLAREQLRQYAPDSPAASWIERTFSRTVTQDSHVVFPENDAPASQWQSVLVCSKRTDSPSSWNWQCVDWNTGIVRWETQTSAPASIAAWTPVHLLIGSPHGWQARSPETGRLIWDAACVWESQPRLVPWNEGVTGQFAWPASFDVEHGLQFFDPDSGEFVCRIKPEGRLHSVVGIQAGGNRRVDDDARLRRLPPTAVTVFLQTVKPTRTWLALAASPRDRWRMEALSLGGEPWSTFPVNLGSGVFGMTSDHRLTGLEWKRSPTEQDGGTIADGSLPKRSVAEWVHSGFATGQGPPFAFAAGQNLFVISDGMQIAAFDQATGRRRWWSGLSDFPVIDPAHQTCVQDGAVFATSQGTLRSVDLKTGSVRFDQYLGSTLAQWRTTIAWAAPVDHADRQSGIGGENQASEIRQTGFFDRRPVAAGNRTASRPDVGHPPKTLIAVWPTDALRPDCRSIRICDADTGTVLQQLSTDAPPKDLVIRGNGTGILWVEGRISGLKFAAAKPVTTATNTGP